MPLISLSSYNTRCDRRSRFFTITQIAFFDLWMQEGPSYEKLAIGNESRAIGKNDNASQG
ncbi:MAG: hypothetical protein AAGA60_27440 [Cyanobacteria bacterium P01_E01_bin.42]